MPDERPPTLIAITVLGKFNQSREVQFQTTVPLDAEPKEIYKQFSKVCDIMDRRDEYYMLKGLQISLERDEAQYKTEVERVANLEKAYQNEWDTTRRGPFKLSGQQKTNVENQHAGLKALRDRIAKIKSEIAELEKLQKQYE